MGFSAYILESLKRYGKAEMGPYGIFVLDYQPAQWNIAHQYFNPPQAKLTWSPANGNPSNLDLLVYTVSRMHEMSGQQSLEFIQQSFEKIESEIRNTQKMDLGILGSFSTGMSGEEIFFKQNPDLAGYFEYTGLALHPLPAPNHQADTLPSSWIWVVLIGLMTVFLWIISGSISPKDTSAQQSIKSDLQENQQMKGVNLAPAFTDTLITQDEPVVSVPLIEDKIIITGTFCKPSNIRKMKEKIEYYQFQVYEEFVDDDCVRLGIYLNPGDNVQSTLEDIRRYIEPNAWVLN